MHEHERRKGKDVIEKVMIILKAIKTHNACLHLTSTFF
jgi:hypothetical protein